MPSLLLAFEDVGLGVQLQEVLEALGHTVVWDGAQAEGPVEGRAPGEVVVLSADDTGIAALADRIRAWRDADPPPALLVMGSTDAAAQETAQARATYLPGTATGDDINRAIDRGIQVRFSCGLESTSPERVAMRALAINPGTDPIDTTARIIVGARNAEVDMVREALRWYANDYVTVDASVIAELRERRALDVPEIEFLPQLGGTVSLNRALRSGGRLDPWRAARFIWALVSAGVAQFTPEPLDLRTTARRQLGIAREHLRTRQALLEGATYYDVLEVPPTAELADIDKAARMLSIRYSPERLAKLDLSKLQALVEPTWNEILTARHVLRDWAERSKYNDKLTAQAQSGTIRTVWARSGLDPAGAAEALRRGQESLLEGEPFRAVSDMALACRLHPGHPEFEASLAWARYRADVDKGLDRDEVAARERALAQKFSVGHRPWPRALLALGLLCAADDDSDAARWHLHEALTCDPELPAARQLLKRLGARASMRQ